MYVAVYVVNLLVKLFCISSAHRIVNDLSDICVLTSAKDVRNFTKSARPSSMSFIKNLSPIAVTTCTITSTIIFRNGNTCTPTPDVFNVVSSYFLLKLSLLLYFQIAVIVSVFGLFYYSYYYFDSLHFHVARGYAHLGYPVAQHRVGQHYMSGKI